MSYRGLELDSYDEEGNKIKAPLAKIQEGLTGIASEYQKEASS